MMNHRPNAVLAAAGLLLAATAFVVVPKHKAPPPPKVDADFAVPVPLDEWTTDAGVVRKQAQQMILGKLPSPIPNQKTKDCDPDLGEEMRRGACWMKTVTQPPCPKDKQWEEDGACFRPVPRMAKVPTSGGGKTPAIAE